MEPTEKAPEIDALLIDVFGVDRRESVASCVCSWCGGDANEFRDALSRKEYRISGLCQTCQDRVFG